MKETILVTGGARSGKSRFALSYADEHYRNKLFIATAEPLDQEMAARIETHRRERGHGWKTVEESLELENALADADPVCRLVLIDCVTLWISNLLKAGQTERGIRNRAGGLAEAVAEAEQSVILVSNEVGWGIVPENPLSRVFRDLVGWTNQTLAHSTTVVVCTIAGLPHVIKGDLQGSG